MKVHELLTDETKWCKGDLARNSRGRTVSPKDDTAVCWCMLGAMLRCYPKPLEHLEVHNLLENYITTNFNPNYKYISISAFNDKTPLISRK